MSPFNQSAIRRGWQRVPDNELEVRPSDISNCTAKSSIVQDLYNYITNKRLSEALDLLEERGLTEDVAIFMVASIQSITQIVEVAA